VVLAVPADDTVALAAGTAAGGRAPWRGGAVDVMICYTGADAGESKEDGVAVVDLPTRLPAASVLS
jgi:hypothetical protein